MQCDYPIDIATACSITWPRLWREQPILTVNHLHSRVVHSEHILTVRYVICNMEVFLFPRFGLIKIRSTFNILSIVRTVQMNANGVLSLLYSCCVYGLHRHVVQRPFHDWGPLSPVVNFTCVRNRASFWCCVIFIVAFTYGI